MNKKELFLTLLACVVAVVVMVTANYVANGGEINIKETLYKYTPKGREDYKRRTIISEVYCYSSQQVNEISASEYSSCVTNGIKNPDDVAKKLFGSSLRTNWESLSETEQEHLVEGAKEIGKWSTFLGL